MLDSLTLDAIDTMKKRQESLICAINSVEFPKYAVAEYEPGFCAYLDACDLAERKVRTFKAQYDLLSDAISHLSNGDFQHAAVVLCQLMKIS